MTRIAIWTAILVGNLALFSGAAAQQLPSPRPQAVIQAPHPLQAMTDGYRLTAAEAQNLEEQLLQNPEDLTTRSKLIGYYFMNAIPEPRLRHIFWLIEHHPESEYSLSYQARLWPERGPLNSKAEYDRAKALWLQQAATYGQDPRVLANAAQFVGEVAPYTARDLLERARKVEPSNPQWTARLASLLARAIYNSSLPPAGITGGPSDAGFIAKVTDELEKSNDVVIIGTVGELLARGAKPPISAPNKEVETWLRDAAAKRGEFARLLLTRAQSLDPDNPEWAQALEHLRLAQAGKAAEAEPARSGSSQRIRVGAGVQASNLRNHVPPVYPPLALQARIQGTVRLQVSIAADGRVSQTQVISGHPLLLPAALEAVKQWIYQPTLLNGNPVEVITEVHVPFALPR